MRPVAALPAPDAPHGFSGSLDEGKRTNGGAARYNPPVPSWSNDFLRKLLLDDRTWPNTGAPVTNGAKEETLGGTEGSVRI